jgi:hypothetical protein
MEMPGRRWRVTGEGAGRFGYNAQERDDEVSGEGNHYTAMFWEYDPRMARRWNLDPKPVVGLSEYATFELNPIRNADALGDSINPGNLTERDKDGNLMHRQNVQAFEAFAKTNEGRQWILDRAQKGFEYRGVIDKNLVVSANRDGRLSKAGVDYEFSFVDDLGDLGSTKARIDKGSGRLKIEINLYSGNDADYFNSSLAKLNTFLHESTYHGDAFERVYLEQTYALSRGYIDPNRPLNHSHNGSFQTDGLSQSFYGRKAAGILLNAAKVWSIGNVNEKTIRKIMWGGFNNYEHKVDKLDSRIKSPKGKK